MTEGNAVFLGLHGGGWLRAEPSAAGALRIAVYDTRSGTRAAFDLTADDEAVLLRFLTSRECAALALPLGPAQRLGLAQRLVRDRTNTSAIGDERAAP